MTQIFESLFAIPTNSIDNIALLDIRCFWLHSSHQKYRVSHGVLASRPLTRMKQN
jgi:hypothetical protein